MKKLPLYTDRRLVIEKQTPIADIDAACSRCKLHEGARTVCMAADGVGGDAIGYEGAVLILGDFPTEAEDHSGRPVSHGPNSMLRDIVEAKAGGVPIVYANAVRCAPRGRNVTARSVLACSAYTLGLIQEIKPSRVLCFGKYAYQSVLGTDKDSVTLGRRGYGYMSDKTPVFVLNAARRVAANRFLRRAWEKDVEWALTAGEAEAPLPPWDSEVRIIETIADSEQATRVLAEAGVFTYDTEYAGLQGDDYFQVICLAAVPATSPNDAFLWGEDALRDPAVLAPLQAVLNDANVKKVGHNLKVDFKAAGYGLGCMDSRGVLTVRGVDFDTMLAVRALDTECVGKLSYADHRVGMGGHKSENQKSLDGALLLVKQSRANARQRRLPASSHPALEAAVRHPQADPEAFAYALVPRETLYRYCALDTVATARLREKFGPVMHRRPNWRLVRDECHRGPTQAIAQIESWGMSADRDAARLFGKLLEPKRDACLTKIRALGCDADLGSSQQLSTYLYETLGLPVQAMTDGGQPKVDKHSLMKLQGHHEVVGHLLEHAKLQKLLSTYVDGLIPHIRPDGRIRSSLNIAGARSGRMSSSNPNLQNIPSGGEYAKMAKSIFHAPPGHVLIQLDYSQLEVRIAAMLSQEPALIQAYIDGVDVHRRTASRAFSVEEGAVSNDQRRSAKTVVFGVLYGKTVNSLAKDLGVSVDAAEVIFNSVLGGLPVLTQWMKDQRTFVQQHGVCWTYIPNVLGALERARVRQLWQIAEPDTARQSRARNGAVNTPIQGSASDFMLRTLVAVVDWIIRDGVPSRVTNTVHDSIILEAPYAWAIEVAEVVKDIMEGWPSAGVPLVADVDLGLNWGALHKLEGLKLVAQGYRSGMTPEEILHLASADKDLSEEMGDDPRAWLTAVSDLAEKVGA